MEQRSEAETMVNASPLKSLRRKLEDKRPGPIDFQGNEQGQATAPTEGAVNKQYSLNA